MAINSMTGFARSEGSLGAARWHWEVRSVNGRGLDMRFRLAPGFEALEPSLRESGQRRFARGSFNVTLNLQRETGAVAVRLNEAVLSEVMRAAERVHELAGGERPGVAALLGIRGVLEIADGDTQNSEELSTALRTTFATALDAVATARASEGRRLKPVLDELLVGIEKQVALVAASPSRTVEAVRRRLAEQVARLLDTASSLDHDRLYQEAALLATRVDVEEELKRLTAHVAAASELLFEDGAVGRKLDFLAQEFNREANTLCSKANDPEITRAGLALKSLIDQLREQVQNIE
jgi:uncharacterized protein (TIGR00255 family)